MSAAPGSGGVGERVISLRDEVLGEDVVRTRLASGLTVFVHRKPGFRKKFAVLAANFGSVDGEISEAGSGRRVRIPEGAAHFLEHKLFEQEDGDAFEVFARQGASANAETSFRTTSFFFHCPDRFPQNLRTLLGVVGRPQFTEAAVEKEKEIIIQEIRMYEDSPDWLAFNRLLKGLYHRHPVRNDIAGSEASVRSIDRDALLACYRTFYDPGNLCLVVSGDVDPGEVFDLAREEFTGRVDGGPLLRHQPREPLRVAKRRTEGRLDVKRPKLLIGFKDPDLPSDGEALRRRDLLTAALLALLFGASSVPRQRLYEDGVIDDSFYASYAGEEDFGFLTLGVETDEPEKVRRVLFREIRSFGRAEIDGEDFGRVIHKLTGHFVRGLDSQEATAFLLLASAFRGVRPFDVPALLRRITPDDIRVRHARLFGPDNHSTSIIR